MKEPWFNSWVKKIHWSRDRLPTPIFLGFPGGPAGEESTYNVGDPGSIPGLGRSPGEGNGTPALVGVFITTGPLGKSCNLVRDTPRGHWRG